MALNKLKNGTLQTETNVHASFNNVEDGNTKQDV